MHLGVPWGFARRTRGFRQICRHLLGSEVSRFNFTNYWLPCINSLNMTSFHHHFLTFRVQRSLITNELLMWTGSRNLLKTRRKLIPRRNPCWGGNWISNRDTLTSVGGPSIRTSWRDWTGWGSRGLKAPTPSSQTRWVLGKLFRGLLSFTVFTRRWNMNEFVGF